MIKTEGENLEEEARDTLPGVLYKVGSTREENNVGGDESHSSPHSFYRRDTTLSLPAQLHTWDLREDPTASDTGALSHILTVCEII